MAGAYPHFKTNYSQEELAEEFLLTSGERGFISTFRGDANRRRVAILLKVLPYLGYFPVSIQHVPVGIHPFISGQLGPLEHENLEYPRDSRTYDRHKDRVRAYKDWRAATARNKEEL
ncbi:MAG: DUF4158 domain-containing protein, partial [Acidobacteriota bacterium]|nr:DUF4158 domain-containing protein [Acidobacteriota bacterium]